MGVMEKIQKTTIVTGIASPWLLSLNNEIPLLAIYIKQMLLKNVLTRLNCLKVLKIKLFYY